MSSTFFSPCGVWIFFQVFGIISLGSSVVYNQFLLIFLSPGLVGLAISYALSVTDRLSGMVTSFTETEKQMVSVERAVQYIEDVIPEHSPRGSVSFKSVFPKKRQLFFLFGL